MRLTVVGCSPAWPNPGGAHSGYLIEAGGRRVLLDCGPGVLSRLLEHERWPRLDAIMISHLHHDHWGDLVPWTWGVAYGPGAEVESPQLWLPPGEAATLLEHAERLASTDAFEAAFDIHEYPERDPFTIGAVELVARRVPHYDTRAFAFRVAADERTLAYSADAGPSEVLVETARDVDLFLCEATLDGPEPEPRGHLTLEEAVGIAETAGARRLLIVHRPHGLPSDGVELAREGLAIEL